MLGLIARFALTGGAATLVHLAVALTLLRFGVPPLIGNAVAFMLAFIVSFCGHHLFTFAGHGVAARIALGRFVASALCGFVVNEAVLASLVQSGGISDQAALFASTCFAALCTFFLSRYWAFSPNSPAR